MVLTTFISGTVANPTDVNSNFVQTSIKIFSDNIIASTTTSTSEVILFQKIVPANSWFRIFGVNTYGYVTDGAPGTSTLKLYVNNNVVRSITSIEATTEVDFYVDWAFMRSSDILATSTETSVKVTGQASTIYSATSGLNEIVIWGI
jgi:hypothetical protein